MHEVLATSVVGKMPEASQSSLRREGCSVKHVVERCEVQWPEGTRHDGADDRYVLPSGAVVRLVLAYPNVLVERY